MKNYWNYRIMAKEYKDEVVLDVYEVYYENNIPYSYSKEPVVVGVYSLDDINKVLSLMRECLKNQYFGMVRSFQKNIKKLTVF